ncbi:MAG: hypothetical protein AAF725_19810 [Acidobacteriota bacterium]
MSRPTLLSLASLMLLCSGAAQAQSVVASGGEFQVNTYTGGNQGFPDVATDGDGTFLLTWESSPQDGSGFGIFGQLVTASGVPVGVEFPINTTVARNQFDPRASFGPNGGFVVVWASEQAGNTFDIAAQRYDALGVAAGGEFQVNTTTAGDQNFPDVATADNGNVLIVWEGNGDDNSFGGINAQLYNDQGTAVGGEFLVNSTTAEEQNGVRVASTGDGFLVVWESLGIDGDGEAVMLQRLDAAGQPVGAETRVSTSISDDQEDADVAVTANGNYAVVWESDGQDGSDETVVAQVFAPNGAPIGGEIVLNTTIVGPQEDPIVTGLGEDSFFATWYGPAPGSGDEVWGRLFDSTGFAVGAELLINTSSLDDQDRVSVAGDSRGRAIAAWRDFGKPDGDAAGAVGRILELAIFADDFETGTTEAWALTSP